MNKYGVIGSNSFLGSRYVNFLLENINNEVIGISRSAEYKSLFLPYAYKKKKSDRFHFYQMDLNKDLNKIIDLFDKEEPEVIINFAALSEPQSSWEGPEHWFQTNCLAIVNLSDQLKDKKYLRRYVHISTPDVYGSSDCIKENFTYNPSTPYGVSKASGDLFLFTLRKNFNFPLILIRPSSVYGEHQRLYKLIPKSIICLKLGRKIKLEGSGHAIKSYIYVQDVIKGTCMATQYGRVGNIYHLSSDASYSVADIVRKICGKMGYDFKRVTVFVEGRLGESASCVIDSSKARTELDWHPQISFNKGLESVIKWVEENWDEILKEKEVTSL